ncbi:MAG: DUF4347 domain-containing protein, partial [Xenococcaceae cyanobacterium]
MTAQTIVNNCRHNPTVKQSFALTRKRIHKALVVIDPRVEDYQLLERGVVENSEVLLLNLKEDGIVQISKAIATRDDIASIHIISHGEPGSFQLGSIALDRENIDTYADYLQQWSNSSTNLLEILIYSCNVAKGKKGLELIDRISQLTKGEVAASNTLTGNSALGGNWNLEITTRKITTSLAFTAEAIAAYAGVFGSLRPGFDTESIPANDDGFSEQVNLGFNLNYFGTTYDSVFVNNNGNITFDRGLSSFTPEPLVSAREVVVAPFWADVDTTGEATASDGTRITSALTTYGTGTIDGRPAFGATWNGVGYYASHVDKLNKFQAILIDRSDLGTSDFDIEFNYEQVQWETGSASGGTNGLGGNSVRVGFSNGDTVNLELPGSAINGAFLDESLQALSTHSLESDVLGRYVFQVRDGRLAISSAPRLNRESDTGISNTDLITKNTTPILTGFAINPGAVIEVFVDGVSLGNATADSFGIWRIDSPLLTEGEHTVTAIGTSEGYEGTTSNTLTVTIDTTPPPTPTDLELVDASDTGRKNDKITIDKTPTIIGKAEAGTIVKLYNDTTVLGETTVREDGTWSIDSAELVKGNYNFTATSTDIAGNESPISQPLAISIRTLAPKINTEKGAGDFAVFDVLDRDLSDLDLKISEFTSGDGGGKMEIDDLNTPNNPGDDRLFYRAPDIDINNSVFLTTVSDRGIFNQDLFTIVGNLEPFTETFTYTVTDNEGEVETSPITVNVQPEAKLKFTLAGNTAGFNNEIGVFKTDRDGKINGIAPQPGDLGYWEAALSNGQAIFSALDGTNNILGRTPTRILDNFQIGESLNFFLVQNGSIDTALADIRALRQPNNVFFATFAANGDRFKHLSTPEYQEDGSYILRWEDADKGGDYDYSDLEMKVELTNE